ncbi:MAG: RNA polymerase sporulation sigma factor SigK [Oscillospiraceae bacterium]
MFSVFLEFVASNILYFALHLESSSFPKPLTATEEIAAFAAYHSGDLLARDKLIRHNLRLVAHVVKKYYSSGLEQDDLISIGSIGLIKAVNSFDSTKGARFATYAARCIENEVLMQLRAGRKTQNTVSIQDSIDSDKDGNSLTINDVVADGFFIDEDYEGKEERQKLYKVVNMLSGRERQIIILRYGLGAAKPLTQQQVADILKISRSYVSRIETKALQIMRSVMSVQKKS